MTDTILLIGTRKGLVTARSGRGRREWTVEPIQFANKEVYAVGVDPRGDRPRLGAILLLTPRIDALPHARPQQPLEPPAVVGMQDLLRPARGDRGAAGELVQRHVAGDGHVVVEARGNNLTRTGVRYDNDYCLVFQLENGKIRQIREYCDSVLTEKALGKFPAAKIATAG